ncbi:MAG: hypothetical protein HYX67_16440 [Candidatus Melainabacteria bacterium]|nr:hypothetical protein [Candidatus Melainabacteria bacterium]
MNRLKRPRKFDCVFSGTLHAGTAPREALWSVLKERTVNFGILRIVDVDNKIEGDIGIYQGTFVVGACLRGGKQDGYNALKLLLAVRNGSYKFINYVDPLPADLDNFERIRITSLISIWPNLPLSVETLSSKISMNRMRRITTETAVAKNSEASVIDRNVMEQLQAWDERHMNLRAAAFWSTFVAVSCLAALLGMAG